MVIPPQMMKFVGRKLTRRKGGRQETRRVYDTNLGGDMPTFYVTQKGWELLGLKGEIPR